MNITELKYLQNQYRNLKFEFSKSLPTHISQHGNSGENDNKSHITIFIHYQDVEDRDVFYGYDFISTIYELEFYLDKKDVKTVTVYLPEKINLSIQNSNIKKISFTPMPNDNLFDFSEAGTQSHQRYEQSNVLYRKRSKTRLFTLLYSSNMKDNEDSVHRLQEVFYDKYKSCNTFDPEIVKSIIHGKMLLLLDFEKEDYRLFKYMKLYKELPENIFSFYELNNGSNFVDRFYELSKFFPCIEKYNIKSYSPYKIEL